MTSRTIGVPFLVPALCNERLPKDFKGPRKVRNYTTYLPTEAWMLTMLYVQNTSP